MEPLFSDLLPDDTQTQPSAAYQWAMSPEGKGLDEMYRSISQFAAGNPDQAAIAQAQAQFGVSPTDYQNALAWAAQQNPGQVEAAPTTTPPVGPTGTPAGIATLASAAQQTVAPSPATPYSPSGIATVAPAAAAPTAQAAAPAAPVANAQQKEVIDYIMAQPSATGAGTQADVFASQGIQDWYNNPTLIARAQDEIDRANRRTSLGVAPEQVAPWSDPNWRTYLGTNKEAYNTAKQVLADPAYAAKFSAQTGLTGANLNNWLTSAISPETRARQQLAAAGASNLVAGPGGNDPSRYSEYHKPGEAITSGLQFSRQYTPDELAAVRNGMDTYRQDPASMAKFMSMYGITKDDAGLILGVSKAGMDKFLGENKDLVPTAKSDSNNLGALANLPLGAANAWEAAPASDRQAALSKWMAQNGVDSKTSGQTSDEYKWTPYVINGKPASVEQGHALDKSYNDFVANYNKTHDFQPFSLNDASKLNAFDVLDTKGKEDLYKNWAEKNNVTQMISNGPDNLRFSTSTGPTTKEQDAALSASYNQMIADYNAKNKVTPESLLKNQTGIGTLVAANAAAQQNKAGTPASLATPTPSSPATTPLSTQDFSTQFTALQAKKDATPAEWTSFLSSALANPQIKAAYGEKLMPTYQALNTQQFSQTLLKDPYASGTDLQKQIKTMMDDPAAKEKYGDKLQAIYDKAGTTQSGWYGGKQYDSLNPLAVDNIYNQLKAQQTALGTDKLMQGGALRGGDGGFGSVDAVTMDMAKNLAASGVTDIKQVGQGAYYVRQPVQEKMLYDGQTVEKQGDKYVIPQYAVNGETGANEVTGYKEVPTDKVTKGYVTYAETEDGGGVYRPLTEEELKTLSFANPLDKNLTFADNARSVLGNTGGMPTIKVKSGEGIINKDTGERLKSNYSERTQGPMWSGTFKGDGNTGYGVQFDPATGTPVFFTRGASSANLGPLSMALGIASFIPGVAPFAMAANAALSASQGNWLGALSSGLGALGGIGNLSASTMSNLNTLKSGINLANAVNNKDWLGALSSGSSLAGLNLGDMKLGDNFSVKDVTSGLSVANALQKGDLAGLLSIGAQLSGSKDAVTAMNGLALMKAVNSGNPAAMTSAVAKLQNSQTPPPGKAAGGLLQGPAPVKVPHSMTSVDPRMFQGVAANLLARRA